MDHKISKDKEFLSSLELAKKLGVHVQTFRRRLKKAKEQSPERIDKLTSKSSRTTLYLYPDIIAFVNGESTIIPKEKVTKRSRIRSKCIKKAEKLFESPERLNYLDSEDLDEFRRIKNRKDKQFIETAIEILWDYSEKFLTLNEACRNQNISDRTFRYWRKKFPFISGLYYKTKQKRRLKYDEELKELALRGLQRLVNGETYEEITIYYKIMIGPSGEEIQIPKEKKIVIKHLPPNPPMIQFALCNLTKWLPPAQSDRNVDATPLWERKINELDTEQLVELIKRLKEHKLKVLESRAS